jgi:outer membrane protein
MFKIRFIISLLGLLLVIVLYKLPGGVVDNGNNNLEAKDQGHVNITDSLELSLVETHRQVLSDATEKKIENLKLKISEADENSRIRLTDSLSNLYVSANFYDSAAMLYENLYLATSDDQYIQRTADLYYDAYNFAMNRDKASSLGGKARQYYNMLLDQDTSRLDIKNRIAMTYVSSSNPMRGISMLREILEQDPQNEDAIYSMGLLSLQSGQYDKAVERFEQLIKINSGNLQGQFYLGLCFYELGERDKARTQFELVKSMGNDPAILSTVDNYLNELKNN